MKTKWITLAIGVGAIVLGLIVGYYTDGTVSARIWSGVAASVGAVLGVCVAIAIASLLGMLIDYMG